jgi:hypothetical protein
VTHESFCIPIVICKELDTLLLHHATSFTLYATNLELKKDPNGCTRQIPGSMCLSIIPAPMNFPAGSAYSFFERRVRRMMRASESHLATSR